MSARPGIRVSGIVLAGGQSTRFGSDKLVATLGGRPLLHWPIETLASVSGEVVVVVGSDRMPPLPNGLRVPLRIVRDDEPGAGPLAGLLTGLEECAGSRVIVVAGDMPGLVTALLDALVQRLGQANTHASALQDGSSLRPLPVALRRSAALEAARTVRAAGGSSLRALLASLRVDVMAEDAWRRLDPAGDSLRDVDRPEDLRGISGAPDA